MPPGKFPFPRKKRFRHAILKSFSIGAHSSHNKKSNPVDRWPEEADKTKFYVSFIKLSDFKNMGKYIGEGVPALEKNRIPKFGIKIGGGD